MTRRRQHAALAAIVLGVVLAIAGTALGANLWLAMQFVRSNHVHDTYFVAPGAWMLLIFGVGVVGDMAFRSQATRFGRHAVLVWRIHLLFTSALIIAALVASTQVAMTWPLVILLLATSPLILIAHGAALAAGGVVVLRTSKQA